MSIFGVILVRIFLHSDWIRKDTEYGVSLRIQSECEKMRTRITPITDTFHAGNTSVILEAQNHLIFSKNSILPQKFEIFFKIWVVDAGYLWFNLFLFWHSDLNIRHCFLVLFSDKFISSITFCTWWKFNCSNPLSWGMTHSLCLHEII